MLQIRQGLPFTHCVPRLDCPHDQNRFRIAELHAWYLTAPLQFTKEGLPINLRRLWNPKAGRDGILGKNDGGWRAWPR